MFSFRNQVQGFAVGAAAVAGIMLGAPAMFPAPASATDATQIAEQFGVTIVWSTAPCALLMDPAAQGCYLTGTPDTVYVSPSLDDLRTRYAVLHEIGHVVQHRLNESISECGADQFAQSLGARFAHYC